MSKLDYISASVPPLSDIDSVRRGIGGAPVSYTQGGDFALGSIAVADEPTATDTMTFNGIWVEFSASATDFGTAGTEADPFILQLAGLLATTLTNLATALNGSVNASLAVATYDGSSGTSIAVAYDTVGVAGNLYTLAASSDTPSGATLTGGQDTPTVNLDSENITVALTQATDQAMIIPDGVEFQKQTIVLTAKSTGDLVVTPTNLTGGSTLTFGTADMFSKLEFLGGSWQVVSSTSTLA